MAKSLYLSSARFDGEPPDRLSEYERELDRLGRTIDEGATIEFDPSELARLQERAEREFPLPPVPVFAFFVGTFICVAILGLAVWYFYWLQHRAI